MNPLRIPHFEYAPMKVSFKKKVQLSDLTPKNKKNLVKELGIVLAFCFAVAVAIVCAVLFLMDGETFDDAYNQHE
jgi:hypothetical protein